MSHTQAQNAAKQTRVAVYTSDTGRRRVVTLSDNIEPFPSFTEGSTRFELRAVTYVVDDDCAVGEWRRSVTRRAVARLEHGDAA